MTPEKRIAESCLLYYITDRRAFPGNELARRGRLLEKILEAASAGVDFIQLREKDLPARELESLALQAQKAICESRKLATGPWPLAPALLINSRTDVALAVGADGVHLRSDDLTPEEVRTIWRKSGAGAHARERSPASPVVAVSCHSPAEVALAAANAASFAVFAPVFEKKDAPDRPSAGIAILKRACQQNLPVLALGGVTLANARSCLEAGAAGIAAIRLFQENDIVEVVRHLRAL
jgi:thiamine-phosphate pyrophosphorylase